jgi:hypothetical protein
VNAGLTIESGGLNITNDGLSVIGGVSITKGGLDVKGEGVFHDGVVISTNGISITGGMTISGIRIIYLISLSI